MSSQGAAVVLVVDDDAAARRMMRRILEREGYEVLEASDGRAGFDAAMAHTPDLVLLDLRMPGELSGIEVAGMLRASPHTSGIPVAIVSASAHLDARDIMSTLGCDAFVEKPVDFDELRAVVSELLASERS